MVVANSDMSPAFDFAVMDRYLLDVIAYYQPVVSKRLFDIVFADSGAIVEINGFMFSRKTGEKRSTPHGFLSHRVRCMRATGLIEYNRDTRKGWQVRWWPYD